MKQPSFLDLFLARLTINFLIVVVVIATLLLTQPVVVVLHP